MIDLRSDTVTKPTPEMIAALSASNFLSRLGDDVYGEDTLTKDFEHEVADMFGKEAALFVPSGTMANQLCVKAQTAEGDEVILESDAHIFNYESAAAGFLSRVQLRTVQGTNGILTAAQIEEAIRPSAYWYPQTRLVCLENTHNRAGGVIYPIEEIERIGEMCRARNLRLHCDGARIWNALAATGIAPRTLARPFDTLAVCFSKGLGAPAGSMVVGDRETVQKAHRFRKMWGGGMRQTGVLTAMARHALLWHLEDLRLDHLKARTIAYGFISNSKFRLDLASVQTNILSIDVSPSGQGESAVIEQLKVHGILAASIKKNFIRLVTHLGISEADAERVAAVARSL